MDVAALSLSIDSSSVVKAAADLDKFSAAATKAGSASAGLSKASNDNAGSIARIAASVQSANAKLAMIVSTLEKIASASGAASGANDNIARSFANADAHVVAYREHLRGLATAQAAVATSGAAADAHVIAYTQHLASLSRAQQDANAHVIAWQNHMRTQAPIVGQADSHVEAYRKHLAQIPAAATAAASGVASSAAAMRANTGNIAAQFQDIGVTAAMGMSPMLIALQQGTQLSAVFAQSGGSALATLRAAFASVLNPVSLLTIALVAAVAALIQWAMNAASASGETDKLSKAIDQTKITTYAFSDAQSALGGVIDLTTGKIKTQSAALYGLARAQLEMIRVTALKDRAEAAKTIAAQRGRNAPTWSSTPGASLGGMSATGIGLSGQTSTNDVQKLLDRFSSGKLSPTQAIDGLEKLKNATKLTEEGFIQLTGAIASSGVAGENLKVYAEARKALGGDQGALKQFLNLPDPKKTPKGPKTDAEKLVDIYTSAQADIATEKARGLAEANSLGALEAAKQEKQTALLNSIQQKNIPITDAVRKKVDELADAYATAKIDADVSKVVNETTDSIQRQRDGVADQVKLVGLYGDKLARARREMEAERRLRESLPKGEIYVGGNLTGGLSDDIEAVERSERMEKVRKDAEDAAYAMDRERKGLALTGAAAEAYAYATDRLVAAKRAGIELGPEEVSQIEAAADAYGKARYAIDQQAKAIAGTREVTKGFFADWINGVREGANIFKSFADSVVNSLNRIIDKLLDRTLDSFLDGMFQGGSGGFLGRLLGGKSGLAADPYGRDLNKIGTIPSVVFPNALGGIYGAAEKFAKGGAFTNSIVNTPTLFRFANGAALGEMGEAGPEAIMPLKRGPNGALGVQMHGGGKPTVRMGDVQLNIKLEGAISEDRVVGIAQQAGQAAVAAVRRDFASIAAEYEANGVVMP